MDWWVADLMARNPALLVSWVVWVIGSIVLHELAHGWAAIRLGDRTPIELGHMTWNPLVHMGGLSLLMFALVGIAWGVMPVNPHRLRGRHAEAVVAAAGPAMNLGLAIVAVVGSALWLAYAGAVSDPLKSNVLGFFQIGAFLNLVLLAFNLLPVPPLDGSRILADFSRRYRELIESPNAAMISMLIFIFVFITAFDRIVGPAIFLRDWAQAAILSILPGANPP